MADTILAEFVLDVKNALVDNITPEIENGEKIIYLDVHPEHTKLCPECGTPCPGYGHRSSKPRLWRDSDWKECKVYLRYRIGRVKCPTHGVITESVPWAFPKDRFTKAFRSTMTQETMHSSHTAVANKMRVDWGTIGRNLVRHLKQTNESSSKASDSLTNIGVDETSYQKGHKYISTVVNQDTNEIVWAAEGHGYKTFSKFFQELTPEQRARIKYISGDGAGWIDQCVQEFTPHATRILDPFHVVLWISETIDKVRNSESRELRKQGNIDIAKAIKGSIYALGKAPDDLTDTQKERIKIIKKYSNKLYSRYKIKEDLRLLIKEKGDNAREAISKIIYRLTHSAYKCVKDIGKKLDRHKENFINSISYKLSNARVEANNNKIKLLIRRAYGYRNLKNLINEVLFACSRSKDNIKYT